MTNLEDLVISDKLMFAVDLVDHVILKTRRSFACKTLSILERVEDMRNYIYSRFDMNVKEAINAIDLNEDGSVRRAFFRMMKLRRVDKEAFAEYADSYRLSNFPESFQAAPFLKYCHHVADMAGYFLSYGVDKAPEYAVDLILKAFPQDFMDVSDWNKVDNVARSYARKRCDHIVRSSSSESSSGSTGLSSEQEENSVPSPLETVVVPEGELSSENQSTVSASLYINLGDISNTSVLDLGSLY